MINFSIIIPHKNIPSYLQRCLDSIPSRDDIEIIIVDDNSNPNIVSFNQFPGLNRKNVHIFFTKKGKGAGYARNIGLNHAKGRWILFADADDYFTDNFEQLLNKHLEEQYDIIYFLPRSTEFFTKGHDSGRVRNIQELFKEDIVFFQYHNITPWCKMIKRSYINDHSFLFSEVRWGNDVLFMTKVNTSTNNILIVHDYLYVVEERPGSLTSNKEFSYSEYMCRTKEDLKAYQYALSVDFSPFDDIIQWRCRTLLHEKQYLLLMRLLHSIPNTSKRLFRDTALRNSNIKSRFYINSIYYLSYLTPKLI